MQRRSLFPALVGCWSSFLCRPVLFVTAVAGEDPFVVVFEVERLAGSGPSSASFAVKVEPSWAPLGAKRMRELVDEHFFEECRFFRVIDNFMAQFGIHGDKRVAEKWRSRTIEDDKPAVKISNKRGRISFATAGPGTRTSQLFINFRDNVGLDGMGFTPIAEVIRGMDVVDRIFKVGEGAPSGPGPSQGEIQSHGNKYLEKNFPRLSYIKSVKYESSPGPLVPNPALPQHVQHVQCALTSGWINIEVHPEWSPIGAKRFLDLVKANYFADCALFRAIHGFLVQFGICGDEQVRKEWSAKPPMADDPPRPDIPVKLGTMAYAGYGKNSRGTQMWISFGDSKSLGTQPWETPFAQVVGADSLAAVQKISTEYGDRPDQGQIQQRGNDYLRKEFPNLDYIKSCTFVDTVGAPSAGTTAPKESLPAVSAAADSRTHAVPAVSPSSESDMDRLRGSVGKVVPPDGITSLGPYEWLLASVGGCIMMVFVCRACAQASTSSKNVTD